MNKAYTQSTYASLFDVFSNKYNSSSLLLHLPPQVSKTHLAESSSLPASFFLDMVGAAIESNDRALEHPEMKQMLKGNTTRYNRI